jgi:RNA polymerase-binding transcription factor DksA
MRSSTLKPAARRLLLEKRTAISIRNRLWDDAAIGRLPSAEAHTLLAIFEALRRIDHGTYGLCVRCEAAIDPERLRVCPEAALCDVCEMFSSIECSAAL